MLRLDSFPTHEKDGIRYRRGRVYPFGGTLMSDGSLNFSVYSKDATACDLLLFHAGEDEPFFRIRYPEEFRIGNVFSIIIYDLNYEDLEYGYCMEGPYAPEKGLRFKKEKVLLDPYARLVSGRDRWGEKTGPVRGRIIPVDYDWEDDKPLEIPMKDLVIYEAHVRGFTKDPSSGVRFGGTYGGLVEKIPYLRELGVNCVELLPIFEFDELENTRTAEGKTLYNYWGYSSVDFYAPKSGYAATGAWGLAADELKGTIKRLHKAGIEVILDVVFNHTAEMGADGPYISFRGIDNRTYYLLTPEGEYYNYSGCGNTMNCNNPVVRTFILDVLRYWVTDYHIDGFRFDLAAILSRDENGEPMQNPPLLETLAQDVILGRTKLIAEAWDAAGLYQLGHFPSWGRWAEWNGKFRDSLRRFLRGEAEVWPELVLRLQGSPDLHGSRVPAASINFITCHDGFTLNDLFSFNEKHNLLNGEENRDGCNDNCSWNCGVEGATEDPEVNALRRRQVKNAMALLLMSRGVPMLLAGDEFLNTQDGNNNAYCQDGPVSWLNWDALSRNQDVFRFVQKMLRLRREHPVLRSNTFRMEHNASGYPELSFHGTVPWDMDLTGPALCFGMMYAEPDAEYGTGEDCFLYSAMNAFWEEKTFGLPILPEGFRWTVYACSSDEAEESDGYIPEGEIRLKPRSLTVLLGRRPGAVSENTELVKTGRATKKTKTGTADGRKKTGRKTEKG
ncbi:MAG: glycogen debranching protein GlgX [Eubacterium sp.]|nr:glycogen debranching protein GlgX [Eubacterium sp.]